MRSLTLIPALAVLTSCGAPALTNVHSSPEGLARALLSAVAQNDSTALQGLAVTEQEFRAHIWPSLPAARPERNLPFNYVWGDLRQKSQTSLAAMLAARGGQRYDLVSVAFGKSPTDYAGFRIHREPSLTARNSDGLVEELRLTGSFLEKDGVWKVFSYLTDD
jgi:hypothetical protein